MATFVLEEWYKGDKCTIYSIRKDLDDVASLTEADKFFEKYGKSEDSEIVAATQLMLQFLTNEICKNHGADLLFFNRDENKAFALPFKKNYQIRRIYEIDFFYENYPLRLFCYRISDGIMIVYNGGIKSSGSVQGSEDLTIPFRDAQHYTTKIQDAIDGNIIEIKVNELISDDPEEIIL